MHLDELSNLELVTIAVALLDGDMEYIDREHIAIKVNDFAPGRFNWRKYPKRIDLDAVGAALRDAKKAKNGGLVIGSNSRGWMLSPAGSKWIEELDLEAIEGAESISYRKESISANREAERARLRGTRAYELFTDGRPKEIGLQDFYQFVRMNEYFQSRARERRYTIVATAVAGEDILSRLWELLKERFAEAR